MVLRIGHAESQGWVDLHYLRAGLLRPSVWNLASCDGPRVPHLQLLLHSGVFVTMALVNASIVNERGRHQYCQKLGVAPDQELNEPNNA
jgi:hypothetical protein